MRRWQRPLTPRSIEGLVCPVCARKQISVASWVQHCHMNTTTGCAPATRRILQPASQPNMQMVESLVEFWAKSAMASTNSRPVDVSDTIILMFGLTCSSALPQVHRSELFGGRLRGSCGQRRTTQASVVDVQLVSAAHAPHWPMRTNCAGAGTTRRSSETLPLVL